MLQSNKEENTSPVESLFHFQFNENFSTDINESNEKLYIVKSEISDLPKEKESITLQVATRFEYRNKSHILLYLNEIKNLQIITAPDRYDQFFLKMALFPFTNLNTKLFKTKPMLLSPEVKLDRKIKFFTDANGNDERWIMVKLYITGRMKRDIFIGETYIEIWMGLEFQDLHLQIFHDKQSKQHYFASISYHGDLEIALKYVSAKKINITSIFNLEPEDQLHVWIKNAKNLNSGRLNKLCCAFAKIKLEPYEKKRNRCQRTKCIVNSNDPKWNVIFKIENVNFQKLPFMGLEIHIYTKLSFFQSKFVGGVRLNLGPGNPERAIIEWMDATSMESLLWDGMLNNPNKWVDGCWKLRPDMS